MRDAQREMFISAVGAITKDTKSTSPISLGAVISPAPRWFSIPAAVPPLGTLSLGRNIRRLDINTTVGKVTKAAPGAGFYSGWHFPRAPSCESRCARICCWQGEAAFRPAEAQVLVHEEIWLGDRREDAAAATYSAEDVMIVQRDIGKLAQYTMRWAARSICSETSLRIPQQGRCAACPPRSCAAWDWIPPLPLSARHGRGSGSRGAVIAADAAFAAKRARLDHEQQARA